MKEIFKRLMAETPSFFRRLIALGLTVGGIGAALMEPHVAAAVPLWVANLAPHLIGIGTVAAIIAKLTVKDPEKLHDQKPNNPGQK